MSALTDLIDFPGPVRLGIRLGPMVEFTVGQGTVVHHDDGGAKIDAVLEFDIMGQSGVGDIKLDARPEADGGEDPAWSIVVFVDAEVAGRDVKIDETHTAAAFLDDEPEKGTLVFQASGGAIQIFRKKKKVYFDLSEIIPDLPGRLFVQAGDGEADAAED